MKIKSPKKIIQEVHGTKGLIPMWLTLDVKQLSHLMKLYHNQFIDGSSTPKNESDIPPAIKSVCDHSHGFYFDEKGIITCAKCYPPKKEQTDC